MIDGANTDRPQQTLAPSFYHDATVWQKERKAIFAKHWQFYCHLSEVSEPLTYRAESLAGFPLIVLRDEAGQLRGYHNVCRHRAGPLVKDKGGVCEAHLTCQYHGWKYLLDGRLRLARDFGPAEGFDPRDFSLIPIEVSIWNGLVFVRLEPSDEALAPLDQTLSPVNKRLENQNWDELRIALRRTHRLRCNWKTYVENYLEGYHIPAMHPSLDAEIQSDAYRVDIEGRVVLHHVPPKGDDGVYNGVFAWVWPNIALNFYQSGLMVERMSPIGHDITQLDYLYLMPKGVEVSVDTLAMSDQVTLEDKWITERVQENLDAGVYQAGFLSPRHEKGVGAFQNWVRDAIG